MLNINKLKPHFGLCIDQPVGNFNANQLTTLIRQYKLVIFKHQKLNEDTLTNLSNGLGQLLSPIAKVSNIPELGMFGADKLPWHTDLIHSYQDRIPGLILYSHLLPADQQTVTRFADLDWVISKLTFNLKSIKVQHKSDDRYGGWGGDQSHISENSLIRSQSGKEYLKFSPAHWSDFPDLNQADKTVLFNHLLDLIKSPDNVYDHYWELGDLLFIDNERLSHHREQIVSTSPRILLRSTLFYQHQID